MVSSFTLQPQFSNSESRTTVLIINQVECNVCQLNNIIMICELLITNCQQKLVIVLACADPQPCLNFCISLSTKQLIDYRNVHHINIFFAS